MNVSVPVLQPESDPAALAFTRLGEKVDLLEAAITGLAAKREATPDYSETLGEMAGRLDRVYKAINILGDRPAMRLTPAEMAKQIEAAGAMARTADGTTIQQARNQIDHAAQRMNALAGTIATIREQHDHLKWTACGGLLAGMLIWSFLPGVILRTMPQGWYLPERMAGHMIGAPTMWEAGTRLLRAGSPKDWNAFVEATALLRDNREKIAECEKEAQEAKKPVPCAIRIGSSAEPAS
ncbi:DUF6118 family protein [Sphingomonas sp. LaA6.9]|uniref:DUF6118 family protein n=1 Tax=Sphingomonas sp. LaA6.9 TaxID=2919914 RepID=UPI001F4F1BC8|nr:DUF6118 family protein [Sphingomonas sp. LaA6.9]MCJ8158585.1 DUF6118 family protein [Sphingomonas sp. LaA6.9]